MNRNEKEEQRRQEDLALNRGLMWVGAAIVLELLLLLVNKYYINIYMTEESVTMAYVMLSGLKAVRAISAVGAVLCLVWSVLKLKKNEKTAVPTILAIGFGGLLFCSHIAVAFYDSGMRMLFILVPAWAALALVYYLYQREFFFSAAVTAMGVVGLWLIRHGETHPATMYGVLILFGVVLVAGAMLLGGVRQSGGELTVGQRKLQILPKDANYIILLATVAVNVAAVAVAMLMGGTVAYYLIYVMVAWLFALLVYYTVKMM